MEGTKGLPPFFSIIDFYNLYSCCFRFGVVDVNLKDSVALTLSCFYLDYELVLKAEREGSLLAVLGLFLLFKRLFDFLFDF